jgi:hypothetical protein
MAIGFCGLNHPRDKVIQAGLACLMLQSMQILYSFGFQLHKAVHGAQGVLQCLLEGSFDYRKEVLE